MSVVRAAIVLVGLCLLGPSIAMAQEPILIRFAHVVGQDTPKGVGAELFKKRVEERLPGRVKVEIYPESRKFDDEEIFLALLFGDAELGAPSLSKFRSYSPPVQVFDLPFLFDDVDHVHRFQESEVGQQLLQSMLPQGILGLTYWDNGMRVISATKPIRVPEDASGMLFRIEPSLVFQEQWKLINVATFPMPFSRVADAVQNGLIDGQDNSWSNIYDRRLYRYHKNFTELNHSYQGYMVITNNDFWLQLPDDIRTELENILGEITTEVRRLALQRADQGRAGVLEADDTRLVQPSEQELELWREAWVPLWELFSDSIGRTVIDAALDASHPN